MKRLILAGCLCLSILWTFNPLFSRDDTAEEIRKEEEKQKPPSQPKPTPPPRPEGVKRAPEKNPAQTTPAQRPARLIEHPQNRPALQNNQTHTQQQIQNFLIGKHTAKQPARAPAKADNLRSRMTNRNQFAGSIRNRISQNPESRNWFKTNFWHQHHNQGEWGRKNNWWNHSNWRGIAGWLGWGGISPIYYDSDSYYYPSEYYENDYPPESYGGGGPPPPPPAASGDWMPLGVFALTNEGNINVAPNMYFQLALSNSGNIAGNYYNSATDDTHPLEGLVYRTSQEAAWKIADNENSPIFVTGLYNLTQDQTPVQLNFTDGSSQTLFLIRMSDNQ